MNDTLTDGWWDRVTDPETLAEALTRHPEGKRRPTARKVRLGCAAMARCMLPADTPREFLDIIETAEGLADGLNGPGDLARIWQARPALFVRDVGDWQVDEQANLATQIVYNCARPPADLRVEHVLSTVQANAYATPAAALCHALRDVFGNPFAFSPLYLNGDKLMVLDRVEDVVVPRPRGCFAASEARAVYRPVGWREWNGGTAYRLAAAAYGRRAWDHLPVLADALEEAGCEEPTVLAHCRGPGPHFRGCWVLDFILGKE